MKGSLLATGLRGRTAKAMAGLGAAVMVLSG